MPFWNARWGASLATLVAAAVMPIVLSGAVAVVLLIDHQRSLMHAELQSSVTGLLTAVDMELESQVSTLRALADSPSLEEGNLERFYGVAQRVRAAHSDWSSVAVIDGQGERLLMNTLWPFGAPLPPPIERKHLKEAARTGQPGLGPVISRGSMLKEPFILIRVPHMHDGAVQHIIAVSLRPSRLTEIVARTGAGHDDRQVDIFDPQFTIAAQSPLPSMVGSKASDSLVTAALENGEGLVLNTSSDGVPMLTALRRSERTGWWVGVSTPVQSLMAPVHRTTTIVVMTGIGAAALSLWLSITLGRAIRRRAREHERQSAARLYAAQQRLLRMANLVPCFVWNCSADGIPSWVSDRWLDYAGLRRSEATGRGYYAGVHPEDIETVFGQFARTDLDSLDFELRLRDRDGLYHWHRTKAQALREDDGRFLEWIGVTIEIDSAKTIEAMLNEYARLQKIAKEEAEGASRAKSSFLAAASHDLRQPFQAMHLYHAVLAGREVDPRTRQAIDGLRQAMEAGEELLGALLDVSSFEAGMVQPTIAPFAVAEMIDDVAAECRGIAAQHGIALRHRASPDLVVSDRVLLKRMIRNLVSNSLRYTRQGGILIGCRRRGDSLLIQVWDTGIGIAEADLKRIFEDFYQVSNPARDRSRGLGLGLSIVQRTAQLLGLTISVRSRPGRGSVFTVVVPVMARAVMEMASEPVG